MLEESFGELMSQDTVMVILDYNEVRSLERVQQALNASERLAGIVGTFSRGCRIFRLFRWKSFSPNKGRNWC